MVLLFVVVEVLMRTADISNMVLLVGVLGVLRDVGMVVVGAIVIVLIFVLPDLYSVNVPSDVAVELFMNALTDIMLGVLLGIGVEVWADANTNAFPVVTTALDVSTPLKEFSCWAAFDSRPLSLLDCDRALQTWMPSYHV